MSRANGFLESGILVSSPLYFNRKIYGDIKMRTTSDLETGEKIIPTNIDWQPSTAKDLGMCFRMTGVEDWDYNTDSCMDDSEQGKIIGLALRIP